MARELTPHERLAAGVADAAHEARAEPAAAKIPTGDEWMRRRGLPMIGRGVQGTQPGSNPLAEVIRRDGQRQRWQTVGSRRRRLTP
jgi:hypothetical protein